jgi:hypothetical protein
MQLVILTRKVKDSLQKREPQPFGGAPVRWGCWLTFLSPASTRLNLAGLELGHHRELQNTQSDVIGKLSEARVHQVHILRRLEVRVIGQVKGFEAQFEVPFLTHVELLAQRHIQVDIARSDHDSCFAPNPIPIQAVIQQAR